MLATSPLELELPPEPESPLSEPPPEPQAATERLSIAAIVNKAIFLFIYFSPFFKDFLRLLLILSVYLRILKEDIEYFWVYLQIFKVL